MTTDTPPTTMWGIRLEDGIAIWTAPHNKLSAIWVQCPDCGPQPPKLVEVSSFQGIRLEERVTKLAAVKESASFLSGRLLCSVCEKPADYRVAYIPKDGAKPHEKCNRRCLDGKYICNCACRGKCHGQGKCLCKKENTDA